ncbi:MAG: barstar family protein [Lachnospiraceae bacterium]|nr:barstar family protein [Lachnospiraceae bacterium]
MRTDCVNVILDGCRMTSREALWDYLNEVLSLPDYFGRNLDALFDVLTEHRAPLTIKLINREQMETALGAYGESLLETISEAAEENGYLDIQI